jgi:hypothetical protein
MCNRLPHLGNKNEFMDNISPGSKKGTETSVYRQKSRALISVFLATAVVIAWGIRPESPVRAQSCCLGSPPICDSGAYCDTSNGTWACGPGSPIIVDLVGEGFRLTDPFNGVLFDLRVRGTRDRISWTAVGSDNAWLALDRNGNGKIDDASELFGDATPQPPPPKGTGRNGFLALAVYDKLENGGNGDGIIDSRDAIFSRLRLWHDRNHNGISEPGEFLTLGSVGIKGFSLRYEESRRTDEFGNAFRYRGEILLDDDKNNNNDKPEAGRWAWDVFLKVLRQ